MSNTLLILLLIPQFALVILVFFLNRNASKKIQAFNITTGLIVCLGMWLIIISFVQLGLLGYGFVFLSGVAMMLSANRIKPELVLSLASLSIFIAACNILMSIYTIMFRYHVDSPTKQTIYNHTGSGMLYVLKSIAIPELIIIGTMFLTLFVVNRRTFISGYRLLITASIAAIDGTVILFLYIYMTIDYVQSFHYNG